MRSIIEYSLWMAEGGVTALHLPLAGRDNCSGRRTVVTTIRGAQTTAYGDGRSLRMSAATCREPGAKIISLKRTGMGCARLKVAIVR